ncbi:hypothetical protein BS47DRAFT_1287241 [Hydnum rufescens UP504]|uniref:TRAF-type domain-containing protein n=1 Tax=Hydnum rufescens UP504 TaxID=1448309 RepID=A0A9P6DZ92_9AGAM|nr:hypothetical protein BS47DRAFT_1287241 [Hydnum rufescens UP504]
MPFTTPTATTTCTHTFCKDCITKALAFHAECPVDRSPLALTDLQPATTIVRNLVDELIVQCPNAPFGCQQTCQRQLLGSHLAHECLHVSTHCCEEDCDATLLRRDIDKHYHSAQCPAAEWTCPHCEMTLARSDRASHLLACPEATDSCTHSVNGCPWSGPRRTASTHLLTCPYESIKGFFAVNASRVSTIESENTMLRQKVDRLETMLAAAQREVESTRSSLGPWFRPPRANAPPPPERIQRRRMSVPLNTASFGFLAESDESETSGYPQTGFFDDAVPVHSSQSQPSSAEVPISPYFPALTDSAPMSSYAYSRVAPIDLSTSLEGCLTSLRNSIVTLSTSLDSLERRQDISLATETLRMHEDVASLRAIVHGLRMQVHTIMMDRNWQVSGRSGNGMNVTPVDSQPVTTHAYAPSESTTSIESTVGSTRTPYRPFAGPLS